MTSSRGFSLVELSIVLVILGLLTGGILAGQSLIRAAELRAVTTEFNRYTTAIQTFRDKYMALPGDMPNATRFWSRLNTNADCVTNSSAAAASPGTCDGNGDGFILRGSAANSTAENTQFWRQLALAGLIEGNLTGLSGAMSGFNLECKIGAGCPASKMSNGGWGVIYLGDYPGDTNTYAFNYGNVMSFGAGHPIYIPSNPIFKPEEAWNIDTKMDDGRPDGGRIIAQTWHDCTLATSQTDYGKGYNLTDSRILCHLYFPQIN